MTEMAIVLQEIVAIDRGGKEAYLETVANCWAPYAERTRGMRLLWLGSTIGSTAAWPETMALWELRDWRHYAEVCARMYTETSDDEELREWWQEATKLRLRARSQTLVGLPFSPTLDDHLARGETSSAFVFATYRIRPGKRADFFTTLERRAAAEASRGRQLVGAYEVAFTNDLAYAVWSHATLADLAAYEEAHRGRAWSDGACESWSEHWGFATAASPLAVKDAGAKVW